MKEVVNKAYKFRIYPNNAQKVFFAKHFSCVRFVDNCFSLYRQGFNAIHGNFYCESEGLASLEHYPVEVRRPFYCKGDLFISIKEKPNEAKHILLTEQDDGILCRKRPHEESLTIKEVMQSVSEKNGNAGLFKSAFKIQ